ncbi:type II toxin-antitoxin system Phd/YefM family antitoxin [Actinoplanes sp. RD1]|uniref:type II toxin-antitoxin system Phd/YefM family antitoxin n=1 Tax=Actinoplanes sp. RD1 TaxID=3064538 RepID=UPI0027407D58|nr:type II toxin-antitoxin system Phd/YefM family antitoxin [Actinoplanes sp. RD1]
MAHEVPVTQARAEFADLINRASYGGERIVIARHGKPIAALISAADLERLERLDVADHERLERPDAAEAAAGDEQQATILRLGGGPAGHSGTPASPATQRPLGAAAQHKPPASS